MKNTDDLTWPNAAIAAVWGAAVILAMSESDTDNFLTLIMAWILLGLPWLVFLIRRKSRAKVPVEPADVLLTATAGGFVTGLLAAVLVFGLFGVRAMLRAVG